jgi:hypothetical protein
MSTKVLNSKLLRRLIFTYGDLHEPVEWEWDEVAQTHKTVPVPFDTDICTLLKGIWEGLFRLFLILMLSTFLAALAGDAGAWAYVVIQQGVWMQPGVGGVCVIACLVLGVVAVLIAAGVTAFEALGRRRARLAETKGVDYVSVSDVIRAWADKYCFRVELR